MLEKIRSIFEEQFDISPEDITESASFREDLGLDSLDPFEVILELEREYGFEIAPEDLEKMETVADVIEYFDTNGIEV